jgi:hypothetical protein
LCDAFFGLGAGFLSQKLTANSDLEKRSLSSSGRSKRSGGDSPGSARPGAKVMKLSFKNLLKGHLRF